MTVMILFGNLCLVVALVAVSEGKTHPTNVGSVAKTAPTAPTAQVDTSPSPDPYLGFKPDTDPTKRGDQYGSQPYQRSMPVHPYRLPNLPMKSSSPPHVVVPSIPYVHGIRP